MQSFLEIVNETSFDSRKDQALAGVGISLIIVRRRLLKAGRTSKKPMKKQLPPEKIKIITGKST